MFKNFIKALAVAVVWIIATATLGPLGFFLGLGLCYFVFKDE